MVVLAGWRLNVFDDIVVVVVVADLGAGKAGRVMMGLASVDENFILSSPIKLRLNGELGVEILNDFGSNLIRCSSTFCVMVRPFFSENVVV